jgi:hypothetical protein
MEPYSTHWFPTKSGYMRLRFPELRDWSGVVHVSGSVDDPAAPLFVRLSSDPGFAGATFEVRVEESADGIDWFEQRPSRLLFEYGPAPAKPDRTAQPESPDLQQPD